MCYKKWTEEGRIRWVAGRLTTLCPQVVQRASVVGDKVGAGKSAAQCRVG
jgi:hypothetical protein